jgi:hypothetical protein
MTGLCHFTWLLLRWGWTSVGQGGSIL